MAVTLLASQCPPIPMPQSLLSIAAAGSLSAGNAPVAENIAAGQTTPWTPLQRRNATRQDLTGRHGGGGYAIAMGLTLSAPASGLTLTIGSGIAMIDGPVEVESTSTLSIQNNSARAWIWLLQNGTLTSTQTATAPQTACCVLGSVVTIANNITQVDTSGVMYLKGGNLWRQTADTGPPQDSPPASLNFFARTQGGLFYWDGTQYSAIEAQTASLVSDMCDAQEDLETLNRQFRAVLFYLAGLTGGDVLTTDELAQALERASAEN